MIKKNSLTDYHQCYNRQVARLDTCVTVIDGAEFYNNLDSMKREEHGTIAELMMEQVESSNIFITIMIMEQVEFSNVVILNKTDLVREEQQQDILDRISILNPRYLCKKSIYYN